jgi:hypothetical protein
MVPFLVAINFTKLTALRNLWVGYGIQDLGYKIRDPGSGIQYPVSGILDPRFGKNNLSRIRIQGSKGTGFMSQIRNDEKYLMIPRVTNNLFQ